MAIQKPVISEDALADIDEIWLYIAQDNVTAADKMSSKIYDTMYQIADYPRIGHIREELTDQPFRFLSVYDYLIVYDPTKTPVEIVRVLHGQRDMKSVLKS